ncbi:MAG: hypothetical protein ABGX16_25745 [Pirellulales bacterium]
MKPSDDLVLLIHGTYAGSDSDAGDGWWQQGSQTWEELKSKLPRGTRLPEQGKLFHWSGENHERARIKASHQLLRRLQEMETTGQSYHLIGHSHGGSVIWGALRLAALRDEPLKRLKSWSTVGTPFMHHHTKSAFCVSNLLKLVLALFFLNPVFRMVRGLIVWISAALFGWQVNMIASRDEEIGVTSILRAPFLKLMELLQVAKKNLDGSIQIGTYDPTGNQTFFEYLFLSGEGLIILSICLLYMFVFAQLASLLLSPMLESLRIRNERRLEKKVAEQFGSLWLGVWSPDDEAINGLRATLDISVSFISRLVPRERVFLSDNTALLFRPYFWVLAPIYNHLLRPLLDSTVRSRVIKTAQGNNRPAAEVVEVLPAPKVLTELELPPQIPGALNQKVVEEANRHASDIAPKLRNLLAQPSFTDSLAAFGNSINGRELVHTSYFNHPEVLELLLMNIAWSRNDREFFWLPRMQQGELLTWFQRFKKVVGVTMETHLINPPLEGPHQPPRERQTVLTHIGSTAPNHGELKTTA